MVANGVAMNEMLRASRAEAKLSMQLAEEMKKDSVAMKTVRSLPYRSSIWSIQC